LADDDAMDIAYERQSIFTISGIRSAKVLVSLRVLERSHAACYGRGEGST
jgi:hypothetical protein